MDTIELRADGDERTFQQGSAETPDPAPDEVRIRVRAAGICGSDVGAWAGKPAYDFLETPRILGHEYVGEIDAVGGDVTSLDVGDRVVERPLHACGVCSACRTGATHVCEDVKITGFHMDGAFGTYTTTPADAVHPIPESLPDLRAAMVEPFAVAARAVLERAAVSPGDRVLVAGPGPMGAFSALIAEAIGAEVVVGGLPQDEGRFERLAEAGIATADLTETPATALAGELTDGGFDRFVDATGAASVLEDAMGAVRRGGEAVVIGIPSGTLGLPSPSFVRGEKRVSASYGAQPLDFERAIRLLDRPEMAVDSLRTVYAPGDVQTAVEAFAAAEVVKPVLDITAFD
jgi:L-iditol 2-dehydrogenase